MPYMHLIYSKAIFNHNSFIIKALNFNNWQNFILHAFNLPHIFIFCKQKMKPVDLKGLKSFVWTKGIKDTVTSSKVRSPLLLFLSSEKGWLEGKSLLGCYELLLRRRYCSNLWAVPKDSRTLYFCPSNSCCLFVSQLLSSYLVVKPWKEKKKRKERKRKGGKKRQKKPQDQWKKSSHAHCGSPTTPNIALQISLLSLECLSTRSCLVQALHCTVLLARAARILLFKK